MADEKKSCGDRFKNAYGNNEIRLVDEMHQLDDKGEKIVKGKDKTVGTLKVNLDCSEALTGLKAVQREAKKATAALRELEVQEKKIGSEYVTITNDSGKIIHQYPVDGDS